jgi:hypothetical protein
LSEAIRNGYFPFWSPYLYTGFPIHADIQGMTWNPIVLLISVFTKYNMSVLQFEVTIYLIISAIGMCLLLKTFQFSRLVCIIGSISYAACGFITDSASVIPWIASAAFVPFVFCSLHLFLKQSSLKRAIQLSISLCLVFLCGYPSFFIYTTYIVIILALGHFLLNFRTRTARENTGIMALLLGAALLFLLICSPAIISYWQFLPYYSRGEGISFSKAASNPFPIFATISYVIPNAVSKPHNWLASDISMRNSYVGLFVFLFFVVSFRNKLEREQKLILGITLFSFVFSLGSATPLYKLCYSILPLFNTFRHPGNFRLFASMGIILLSAVEIERFMSAPLSIRKNLRIFYLASGALVVALLYSFVRNDVFDNIALSLKEAVPKKILDTISFSTLFFIEGIIQLLFMTLFILLLLRNRLSQKTFVLILALNSILFAWVAQPFTFISQVKTSTIDKYVDSFPKGYPVFDANNPVNTAIFSDSISISPYGYENFYNKKVTIQDHFITPTVNQAYFEFCSNRKLRTLMAGYPFAYFADTLVRSLPQDSNRLTKRIVLVDQGISSKPKPGARKLSLVELKPNSIRLAAENADSSVLTIFQQYNPNWVCRINGNETKIYRADIAFMAIEVPGGRNDIEFIYEPKAVITAAYISVVTILVLLIYWTVRRFKMTGQRRSDLLP